AERAVERLTEAELPVRAALSGLAERPDPARVTVTTGRLEDGFVLQASGLAVLTETDLTGQRGAAPTAPTRMPSRRRNAVDPLALQPGDFVVHSQHGIGRYVELVSRTSAGTT